jgi:hypothetical protein
MTESVRKYGFSLLFAIGTPGTDPNGRSRRYGHSLSPNSLTDRHSMVSPELRRKTRAVASVFDLCISNMGICFGFRHSDFGFPTPRRLRLSCLEFRDSGPGAGPLSCHLSPITCHCFSLAFSARLGHNHLQRNTLDQVATNGLVANRSGTDVVRSK